MTSKILEYFKISVIKELKQMVTLVMHLNEERQQVCLYLLIFLTRGLSQINVQYLQGANP